MYEQTESNTDFDVSFSDKDVTRNTARLALKDGWFRFRVIGPAKNSVAKSNNLMQTIVCAPVDELGNTRGPTIMHRINLPFANPNVPDHTPPKTGWVGHQYLIATHPQAFKRFPKKQGASYIDENGDTLSAPAAEEARNEAMHLVFEELKGRWKRPQDYDGEEFFGKVKTNGDYKNIVELSANEPDDGSQVEYDTFAES